MIVAEVICKQSTQVVIGDDDHVIHALAANALDQPLHVTVLPRTSRCDQNLLNVHSFDSCPERFAVYSVAISNEILRSSVFRKSFDDLLCCPNRRWMLS